MPDSVLLQMEPVSVISPTTPVDPVRKTIRVPVSTERAYTVFTEEMDSWWPRTHHIGGSPMTRVVLQRKAGGVIYTDHEDGTASRWGTVLDWTPPERLRIAWQISPSWQFESDLARCSEVDVNFRSIDGESATLVELEHSELQRHGEGHLKARAMLDSGWGALLLLFAQKTEVVA